MDDETLRHIKHEMQHCDPDTYEYKPRSTNPKPDPRAESATPSGTEGSAEQFKWVCPFCPKFKDSESELKRHIRKHLYRRALDDEATIESLRQRLQDAERERDLAIAHDHQPYPTAEAYEKVCAVLAAAQAELRRIREELKIVVGICASDTLPAKEQS